MLEYRTIYADPPWAERGSGKVTRGAQRHYPLMRTESIAALAVNGCHVSMLAARDAHCYLWTTNNFLLDALAVLKAWGFDYKTMITWAKDGAGLWARDTIGLGQYFRRQAEHCLFGVRGSIPYQLTVDGKRRQGKTLIVAPKTEHSEKPEEMRRMIELVSPGPYMELFARRQVDGWDGWGNDAEEKCANES